MVEIMENENEAARRWNEYESQKCGDCRYYRDYKMIDGRCHIKCGEIGLFTGNPGEHWCRKFITREGK